MQRHFADIVRCVAFVIIQYILL